MVPQGSQPETDLVPVFPLSPSPSARPFIFSPGSDIVSWGHIQNEEHIPGCCVHMSSPGGSWKDPCLNVAPLSTAGTFDHHTP